MLAKRIIPCLDIKNGRVVKGIQFLDLQDAGDPVENAIFYDKEGADELVFLDITASSDERKILLNLASRIAQSIFIPFTVGGGIRTVEDIRELLLNGADKISINTQAVLNPDLIKQSSDMFGSQCIVVAIDVKKNIDTGKWVVYTHGGRNPTDWDALMWAQFVEKQGAGEILLTSMDADGTQDGYDNEVLRLVSEKVNIPVIASGGAGSLDDFYDTFTKGKADAALAASLFHYKKLTIKQVKDFLKLKNVPVRL